MIQFVKRPPFIKQPPARSCRADLLDKLESTMREMAFAGETVSPDTLKQRGYSEGVIARLGVQAAQLARRRSIRRVEHA